VESPIDSETLPSFRTADAFVDTAGVTTSRDESFEAWPALVQTLSQRDILRAVNGAASPHRRKAEALGIYVRTPTSTGSATPPLLLSRGGFGGTWLFSVGILTTPARDTLRESGWNPEIVRLSRHGGGRAASVGA
jgi:hypothetical protein